MYEYYGFMTECKLCGKEYRKYNGNTLYCPECRKGPAKKIRQQKWIVKNPDYFKNYYKSHTHKE